MTPDHLPDGRAAEPAPPSSATTAPLRRQLLDVAWEIVSELTKRVEAYYANPNNQDRSR